MALAAEKRVALVVGNSRYQHVPTLINTATDARLVARTLQGLGFQLVGNGVQLDLDDNAFKKAIAAFGAEAEGSQVALFYYAGHGLQMQGANFLVPVDADPVKPSDVDLQLVDTKIVQDEMQDSGANLKLLILDACRNNSFGGRGLRDISRGLAVMPALRGTLIAYSTQPGNVASDGPAGGDSPFTVALADALRRPGIDALEMFNEVGLAVDKATDGQQQPWLASSPIEGKFYFAGNPPPPLTAAPAASPNPRRAALESRLMVPSPLLLATSTGSPSDVFLGEWYGISSFAGANVTGAVRGREMIFAIQSISGTKVIAVFGWAAIPGQTARAYVRVGKLNGDEIDFEQETGFPRAVVTVNSDNALRVASNTPSGTAIALVQRIDR